jgi:DNA-binding transcriptional MerR regulator
MIINEVCKETGLTKKAIAYYENQELINPLKNHSNYREYTVEDVKLLKEIALYRKLDISINDIKKIIRSSDKRNLVKELVDRKQQEIVKVERQKKYLRRLCESEFNTDAIDNIGNTISQEEKLSGEYIKNELVRIFPEGWGKLLSFHFSPYLNEPVDTIEKLNAWMNIVEFLDNLRDIKIPKVLKDFYESMNEWDIASTQGLTDEKINGLLNSTEELEDYKKEIIKYVESKDSNKLLDKLKPFNKYKKVMKEFYESSGYYDIFIPNMKILSKSYKEYNEKLIMLNDKLTKELGIKYDDNMNIVIIKE